jgi:hypothetical protein
VQVHEVQAKLFLSWHVNTHNQTPFAKILLVPSSCSVTNTVDGIANLKLPDGKVSGQDYQWNTHRRRKNTKAKLDQRYLQRFKIWSSHLHLQDHAIAVWES